MGRGLRASYLISTGEPCDIAQDPEFAARVALAQLKNDFLHACEPSVKCRRSLDLSGNSSFGPSRSPARFRMSEMKEGKERELQFILSGCASHRDLSRQAHRPHPKQPRGEPAKLDTLQHERG